MTYDRESMNLYSATSIQISKLVTQQYSTSFYKATRLLSPASRDAIFSIYGFVRFADEIVDTFHEYPQEEMLEKYASDYRHALMSGISLNPILHAFVLTIQRYQIPHELVESFLTSMKMDLHKKSWASKREIDEYIYGSADVVGLMCLKVFVNGDETAYLGLKEHAMRLGSAFQKVNFLRDLKADVDSLGRQYFPEFSKAQFNDTMKHAIVRDIADDFKAARKGISKIPGRGKLAVYMAYVNYRLLLRKIDRTPATTIIEERIRIPNFMKSLAVVFSVIKYTLRDI
jgi:15-cis-phytoene synthase